MSALRSLLFLLFQTLVTPLYAAVMLVLFWIPRVPMYRIAAHWCWINLQGARWICGIRWRAIGSENIPDGAARTPHIVLSKHSSTWETLALTMYFPPLAYVAKKELLSIPFFGWGFALASPITIDRKSGRTRNAADRRAGPQAIRAGFLDRRVSRRARESRRARGRNTSPAARASRSTSTYRSFLSPTTRAGSGRRASSASGPAW